MQDESNKVHLIETKVDTFARHPFFVQNCAYPQSQRTQTLSSSCPSSANTPRSSLTVGMPNEERARPPPEPPPAGASLASLVTSTHKSPPASTQVKTAAALGKAYAPERGTVAMSGHSR